MQTSTRTISYPWFFSLLLLGLSAVHSTALAQMPVGGFTTPKHSLTMAQPEQQALYYHQVMPPKGKGASDQDTTVLLLGGGPGFSSWNLEPIQKQIAQMGWPTLLMDMVGIGENDHWQPNPVITTWIQQIHQVLRHATASSDSVVLVGHSWGALMAMLYQRAHPERIVKVILLNPVDPGKQAMQNLTAEIDQRNRQEQKKPWDDDAAWEQKTQVGMDEVEAITLKQITQVLPTYFMDYQKGQAYAKQFSVDDFDIDLNIQAWKEYDQNPIRYHDLQQAASDYYFLECKQDYLMPYNLNAMQPNMTFQSLDLMDQCGHFPWIEQPAAFYQHLENYLSESQGS